jgi:deoxyadenosine/deoxycytidine kinase
MSSIDYQTVLIEGNIASGKTTFINYLKHRQEKVRKQIEFINEPLLQWQNCRGYNLFRLFNEDPKRWAFPFESYVQLTMLRCHLSPMTGQSKLKLMERSLFSAKHVFVESLHTNQILCTEEYIILNEWFHYLVKSEPDLKVDLIIYLKTDPQKLLDRIKERGRTEERNISLRYLELLHNNYEGWLNSEGYLLTRPQVWTIDANQGLIELLPIYKQICDNLFHKYDI